MNYISEMIARNMSAANLEVARQQHYICPDRRSAAALALRERQSRFSSAYLSGDKLGLDLLAHETTEESRTSYSAMPTTGPRPSASCRPPGTVTPATYVPPQLSLRYAPLVPRTGPNGASGTADPSVTTQQ